MTPTEISSYLWLLIPVGAYLIFALALHLASRRIVLLARIRVPLHIIALGLCLELSLGYLQADWAKIMWPYGKAMIAFGFMILLIQIFEALSIGYFMVRLQGRHVPPILRRFVLLASYFIVATIILRTYLDLDVTSLIATSAVVSFVVGLASQDLLGSVLAGIVVGIERPLGLEDWVTINDQEGQIIDITWRRTEMRTRDGDLVVLPNSQLMKSTIVNHNRPTPAHRVTIVVGAHYRHPPNKVKNAMISAAKLCGNISSSPAPTVFLLGYDDSSITYRLNVWLEDFSLLEQIRDQINTYIWYQFKREGIEIPFPIRTLHTPAAEEPSEVVRRGLVERLVPLLESADIFRGIPGQTLEKIAAAMRLETYGAGETLFDEGQPGRNLYMIVSGEAQVLKKRPNGSEQKMATLQPGEICGEMSLLLEQPRMATVRMAQDSQIIAMGPGVFKELASEHPEFLEHLSTLVENRRQENAELQALFSETVHQTREGRLQAVLGRIRSALKL